MPPAPSRQWRSSDLYCLKDDGEACLAVQHILNGATSASGDKGSRLSVIKANKIIPKVIQVVEAVGTFEIPKTCPVCGAPTVVRESEVSGTRTLH